MPYQFRLFLVYLLLFVGCGNPGTSNQPHDMSSPDSGVDAALEDSCSDNNGGCGDPRFVGCSHRTTGPVCVDRDPCEVDNGGCGDPAIARCEQQEKSPPNCLDINECLRDNGGCGPESENICINNQLEPPTCDVNECATDNGGCPETAVCLNTISGPPQCRSCGPSLRDVNGDASTCAKKIIKLSVGSFHTCVLSADGKIACAGNDERNKVSGPNAAPAGYTDVVARFGSTCGLKASGEIQCWGATPDDDAQTRWTKLTTGYGMCAVAANGEFDCFDHISYLPPTDPVRDVVSDGRELSCAALRNGTLYCWGFQAQLLATEVNQNAHRDWVEVSIGQDHVCARRESGHIQCWGADSDSQVSGPNSDQGTFLQIAAYGHRTCGVRTDKSVWCWGNDDHGMLTGANASHLNDVMMVGIGGSHLCALREKGNVDCWGDDVALKSSGIGLMVSPVPVAQIAPGFGSVCVLLKSGRVRCVGESSDPDLVDGPNGFDGQATKMCSGSQRVCVLTTAGKIRCWGSDRYSEVSGPERSDSIFVDVSCADHVCGLTVDGAIKCWGNNDFDAIWDPPRASVADFQSIETGTFATCGVRNDHTTQCFTTPKPWDFFNSDMHTLPDYIRVIPNMGTLCAMTLSHQIACFGRPNPPVSGTRFLDFAVGKNLTCGVTDETAIECWPPNERIVLNGTGFVEVEVFDDGGGICGVRENGTFACSGRAVFDTGELFVPPNLFSP